MKLTMPEPVKDPANVPELQAKNAFSLVLGENDNIYWWIGFESPQRTNYSGDGIRKILLQEVEANPQLMVLVKPMEKSRYANLIDILDEISITHITRYAIVEYTEEDEEKLRVGTR